jgi:hypothetical protein
VQDSAVAYWDYRQGESNGEEKPSLKTFENLEKSENFGLKIFGQLDLNFEFA